MVPAAAGQVVGVAAPQPAHPGDGREGGEKRTLHRPRRGGEADDVVELPGEQGRLQQPRPAGVIAPAIVNPIVVSFSGNNILSVKMRQASPSRAALNA